MHFFLGLGFGVTPLPSSLTWLCLWNAFPTFLEQYWTNITAYHATMSKYLGQGITTNEALCKIGWPSVNPNDSKGPVTRYNFSCNMQRSSIPKRCKFVTNVWYVKNILANCDGNMNLPILHLPRVQLHCKLQEKLHVWQGLNFSPDSLLWKKETLLSICL